MKTYYLALDLKDDPELIAGYEKYHKNVSTDIKQSITDAGVVGMDIYRTGNRLFMIMETTDDFSFDNKAAMDAANEKVQEWENMLWKFQHPLPWAKPGEKWIMMEKIFDLNT